MTPEEKADKQQLLAVDRLSKAIRSQFSFGVIKTYGDLLKASGYPSSSYFPSELERKLTFQDVQEFLSDRKIEITTQQWLRKNPPIITYDEQTNSPSPEESLRPTEQHTTTVVTSGETSIEHRDYADKEQHNFKASPNEKAFFYWFQKKAITQLMKGILGE